MPKSSERILREQNERDSNFQRLYRAATGENTYYDCAHNDGRRHATRNAAYGHDLSEEVAQHTQIRRNNVSTGNIQPDESSVVEQQLRRSSCLPVAVVLTLATCGAVGVLTSPAVQEAVQKILHSGN